MRPFVSKGVQIETQYVRLPHKEPEWARSREVLSILERGEVSNWEQFEAWAKEAVLIHWDLNQHNTSCIQSYFSNPAFTSVSVLPT